jgi:hypothetical protein
MAGLPRKRSRHHTLSIRLSDGITINLCMGLSIYVAFDIVYTVVPSIVKFYFFSSQRLSFLTWKVHAHEVHTYEIHAYEVHAREVHAHETQAYEMHAYICKVHVYEV